MQNKKQYSSKEFLSNHERQGNTEKMTNIRGN